MGIGIKKRSGIFYECVESSRKQEQGKMAVPEEEQFIEVLDDKNNTIQVHKNKLNQKK